MAFIGIGNSIQDG